MLNILMGTYVIAINIEQSVEFYTKLFQAAPTVTTANRWAEWLYADGRAFFGLLAKDTDADQLKPNSSTVLNLYTPDIQVEYERCREFVEATYGTLLGEPEKTFGAAGDYISFSILDPDNNIIEIFYSQEDEKYLEPALNLRSNQIFATSVISKCRQKISLTSLPQLSDFMKQQKQYGCCSFDHDILAIPHKIILP